MAQGRTGDGLLGLPLCAVAAAWWVGNTLHDDAAVQVGVLATALRAWNASGCGVRVPVEDASPALWQDFAANLTGRPNLLLRANVSTVVTTGTLVHYPGAVASLQDQAVYRLLGYMLYEPAFTFLRTERQLGYVVQAFYDALAINVPGITIVVQSSYKYDANTWSAHGRHGVSVLKCRPWVLSPTGPRVDCGHA